jgi:Protein of unknown function (DUF3108)
MRFALLALVGCTALPPAPPKAATGAPTGERSVFYVAGEKLEYRAQLRGITVGTLRVAIGEPGVYEGKSSMIVRSRGETTGFLGMIGNVAWELKSTLDLDRNLPIENDEEFWAELIAGGREHEKQLHRWHEHDDYHDAHSAVGRFRGWRSKLGDRMTFRARVGGGRFDVDAHHAGRDYIASAKAHAIRYEGMIARRFPFTAWVSDDPSRVPLRFQASTKWGSIDVDLVEYQPPSR